MIKDIRLLETQKGAALLLKHFYLGQGCDLQTLQHQLAIEASAIMPDKDAWFERFLGVQQRGISVIGKRRLLVNIACYVRYPFKHTVHFDYDQLHLDVQLGARMMDAFGNTSANADFCGLSDALAMMGKNYDTPEGRRLARRMVRSVRNGLLEASMHLSVECGRNPHANPVGMLRSSFGRALPCSMKNEVLSAGLRFEKLFSIQWDAELSAAFGNGATPGMAPILSSKMTWGCHDADEAEIKSLAHYAAGSAVFPNRTARSLRVARDVGWSDYALMQKMLQPLLDCKIPLMPDSLSKYVDLPAQQVGFLHALGQLCGIRPDRADVGIRMGSF